MLKVFKVYKQTGRVTVWKKYWWLLLITKGLYIIRLYLC
jgi:hypothetical protein